MGRRAEGGWGVQRSGKWGADNTDSYNNNTTSYDNNTTNDATTNNIDYTTSSFDNTNNNNSNDNTTTNDDTTNPNNSNATTNPMPEVGRLQTTTGENFRGPVVDLTTTRLVLLAMT